MRNIRVLAPVTWLPFIVACLLMTPLVWAGEAEDALNHAIELFNQARYAEAQEVLLQIERDELSEDERALRDEYVNRTRVAITMVERAELDFEKGEAAIEDKDYDAAHEHFQDVLNNEYSTKAQRSAAVKQLRDLEALKQGQVTGETEPSAASAPAAPEPTTTQQPVESQPIEQQPAETAPPPVEAQPTPPRAPSTEPMGRAVDTERARSLTQEGYDALDAGRTSEAIRLFDEAMRYVPGYPQAAEGIRQAQARSEVEVGSRSLIERIKQRNNVLWGRAVQQYRGLERDIMEAVLNGQFDLARDLLLRARQVIESARQYAEPLVKYQSLMSEVDALSRHVEEESRRAAEEQVRQQREEIQRQEEARRRRVAETRQRQVDALWEQVIQLRHNRDYEEAVKVLDQILAINPDDRRADWMKDDLQDLYELSRQRKARNEMYAQQQAVLVDAEEAKIPWHETLKYPKNWLEIISGPERVATGRERLSSEDRALHAKLDQQIPVDFEDQPFEEVVNSLAESQAVNITVIWNDLEAVGIERDLPVTLRFASDVRFSKALDEILDQVGGGEVQLGYVVNDGVIKIATQAFLDQDTYVDVYPIEDLLLSVPDFEGPTVSVTEGGQGGGGGVGGGGGGFGGGGLGGGIGGFGGMGQQNPFSDSGDTEGSEEDQGTREERVDALLELIRNTISPDSWRESGGTTAAIAELGGQLVVTQTASAHAEVQDLLGKLREQRAIQIAIESRFITITSNYLEELGLDLDVILNQGNAGYDRTGRTYNGAQVLMPRSFSRLGFLPGVPAVGSPLTPGSAVTGAAIGQPYGEVGLVPQAGNGLVHGSNMTPIPVISNLLDLVQPTETVVPNSFGGTTTPAMSIFGSFLDGIQVDFLLRATQADRRSSVMNAPRLVLFNGQRAWVGVLVSTAYVAGVFPVVDENAVAQQPVPAQLQTGTVLDVQAVVSADKRYVTMNLRPGVAQPVGPLQVFPFTGGAAGAAAAADAFIQLPNIQKQVIRTTVSVPDGGTLLIGGMKTTQEIEAEAGVPVLSKLPVLKRLYSARNLVKDEQVLLILVKPKILIQREQEEEAFPTFGERM